MALEQKVLGLQITMRDEVRVAVVHGAEQLLHDRRGLLFCEVALLNDTVEQLTASAEPEGCNV
jgi:hypothetical protein